MKKKLKRCSWELFLEDSGNIEIELPRRIDPLAKLAPMQNGVESVLV